MILTHINPNALFDTGLARCHAVMRTHPITSSEVLRSVNIWGATVNDAMEATGMASNGTEVTVTKLPECDIHKYDEGTSGIEAAFDVKTLDGRWANVCNEHFITHTAQQLGVGRGQRLVLKPLEDSGPTSDERDLS